MQLGFVSAILPDLSLEEILAFTAEAGLDCVELMCWPKGRSERRYAGVTHLDADGFTPAAAEQVRQLCARAGVQVSGSFFTPRACRTR